MGHALICSRGGLTRVVPVVGKAYWLDGSGRIGVDDEEDALIAWYAPKPEGLAYVETTETSDDAFDLLQAVVDEGLRLVEVGRD